MIKILDKAKCCGCTACYSICPNKCISILEDEEGFSYPVIDELKCINCNLCNSVCPVECEKKELSLENESVFYMQNKNENTRRNSTSGGAFASLAENIINENGNVYAVSYGKAMNVQHMVANSMEQVEPMLMSKYVQSYLGDTYSNILHDIKKGKKVLFIGTPCQADGLAKFLGKNRENVIIVDLECYGVPSPLLYRKWIEHLENKYEKKVSNIFFRDKKYGYSGVNIKIVFSDGTILEDKRDAKTFTKSMFSGIGLRPSCYACPFRNKKKSADITLADGWSVSNYCPNLDDDKGTTKMIVHTLNGRNIINKLENCITEEVPATFSLITNGPNKVKHPSRDMFFNEINELSYIELINKYLPESKKDKIANIVKPIIVKMPFSTFLFKEIKKYKRRRRKSEFIK